ncbi:hypothetical protein [Bradyrhizobium sp. CB1015]|uniref:hypothetical protein n=1 Tax=Bradyrhizobium sp. CB1015 TaxID=2976822 RepID=UPI0021AA4385|nr:hypothetical protein [Bradyrhizobium sp. CB1015]UWU96039.1 hypothetical protein N2604_21430 [Bradyrhizobium sp. CB1015]
MALAFASFTSAAALAADLPVKAKPVSSTQPFFSVIDDRITISYIPKATDPGVFSRKPDGSLNSTTAMQVYSFTHFDIWRYGTNFLNISLFKADHNDPASPCTNAGVVVNPGTGTVTPANCAGVSFVTGQARSTFGWNEIFDTKTFTVGPLRNISFQIGLDASSTNYYRAAAAQAVSAGLQFQFDLPYRGYVNIAPLATWIYVAHMGFLQCGGGFSAPVSGVSCLPDGNRQYQPTWAVETNYYMDLGFLPESMRFFSVSGRAQLIGAMGPENAPLPYNPLPVAAPTNSMTKMSLNSEPIRLTFDASKAIWGPNYSHYVDIWVAYRYWQNKFGLDHNVSRLCTISPGVSNNTCTESSLYSGISMKF